MYLYIYIIIQDISNILKTACRKWILRETNSHLPVTGTNCSFMFSIGRVSPTKGTAFPTFGQCAGLDRMAAKRRG